MPPYIPRAKRSHHPVLPVFRWTDAKRKAIQLLSEYYVLRVQDIALILKGDENTRRSFQTTLSLLLEKDYVGRRAFIDDMAGERNFAYGYYLNDSGAALAESGRAFEPTQAYILRHEMELTQFHIHLKQFCEKHKLILTWHQPTIDHKKAINPDAYFGITDPSKPEGKNTFHYFLEIERSKIGNYREGKPSIIRKLQKYHEYYDTEYCEREWGFRKFRVILTLRNAERQYNLCARLPKENMSHRMFWITTEPLYKENVGGEIFRTPKDFEKAAYSFLQS